MIFRVLGERGDNVIKIKLTDNCRQLVPYKLCRKPVFAVTLRRGYEGAGHSLNSKIKMIKTLGIPVISRVLLWWWKLSEYSDRAR